eukprot:scaffold8490_cov33-Phaeocystis_antarctica.AAC.1
MTAESMCTIVRLSARCLPPITIDRNLLCFCDLAGYHPLTAESMCTICRLSARCLPPITIDRNLLCFCDLAGYHPLSSKLGKAARGHVSRDSRAGAAPPHTTHARRDR